MINNIIKFVGLSSLFLAFMFAFDDPLNSVAFSIIYLLCGLNDVKITYSLSRTPPKKLSKKEEKDRAIKMREAGRSMGDIARVLGRSKGTIHNWLKKGNDFHKT